MQVARRLTRCSSGTKCSTSVLLFRSSTFEGRSAWGGGFWGDVSHNAVSSLRRGLASLPTVTEGKLSVLPSPGPQRNVVEILSKRGLVQEVTSEHLEKLVETMPLKVYCGFDPTADSLHLGNLLGIIVLSWFQRCGHTPIALLGGATGRVGDPSGRSSERPIMTDEEIEHNVRAIGRLLADILDRNAAGSGGKVEIVNNLDWFGPMSFLTFLREVGKVARVNSMISKESVRTRLESEQGISFTEFTYQLLQGYDFVHLYRDHRVRVQVGGSDQWGNITAGTDLIRKLGVAMEEEEGAPPAMGLTFPLLVDSEGRKFGKSVGGAIWLSAEKLSPYKFYQHLFNVADSDVIKFLKMLTFVPLEEIHQLEVDMTQPKYVPNTAQRRLAEEVTRFVHGEEGLRQAMKATEALRPGSQTELDVSTLESIAGEAPSVTLPRDQLVDKPLVDVMVTAKMLASKAEVRRMIKGGGVYLNNKKVQDQNLMLGIEDLIEGRLCLVAAGKKNKMLIRVAE